MTSSQSGQVNFKQLREQAGLSQEALARIIGVSSKTVSNWERGISAASLTVTQMKALCNSLSVKLDDLPDDFSSDNDG